MGSAPKVQKAPTSHVAAARAFLPPSQFVLAQQLFQNEHERTSYFREQRACSSPPRVAARPRPHPFFSRLLMGLLEGNLFFFLLFAFSKFYSVPTPGGLRRAHGQGGREGSIDPVHRAPTEAKYPWKTLFELSPQAYTSFPAIRL